MWARWIVRSHETNVESVDFTPAAHRLAHGSRNWVLCLSRIGAFPVSFEPAVQTVAAPPMPEAQPQTVEADGRVASAGPPGRAASFPVAVVRWARRHPDLTCLLVLLLIGGALRLAFAFRAPPLYVGGDSADLPAARATISRAASGSHRS